MSDILRAQLLAVRAQLDGARATIDACLMFIEPQPEQPQGCQHPEEAVLESSTLAGRSFKCVQCGAEWPA